MRHTTQGFLTCPDQILKSDGSPIKYKNGMLYLGSFLAADGRIDSEISRRLGIAQDEFRLLNRIWNHAYISDQDKLHIFNACIISKLIYGFKVHG